MEDRITIAGRELVFAFDTRAWVDLEKTFGSMNRMYKRFEEDVLPMTTGLQLAAITATAGTCDREDKTAKPISFEWLAKNATPAQAREMVSMAKSAVIRGLGTTESLYEENGAQDMALEENNAKKIRAEA